MKSVVKLLIFTLLLIFSIKPVTSYEGESMPQGFSPFAIAITEDGKYAYIGFDLSEVVFKVRLEDLAVVAVADLSEYFPIESEDIALDASEEKLFVCTPTWQKLLVLDTQTMSVIHTIDDIGVIGITRSQYGPFLIAWSGGGMVKLVNTETYAVTEFIDDQMKFVQIRESDFSQDKWYVVSGNPWEGYKAGIYDHQTKTWNLAVTVPLQVEGEGVHDFEVSPNEQKAYVATVGGFYPDGSGYGWLYSVDLVSGEANVVPIVGAALCLEASLDNLSLYVGTGWPSATDHNIYLLVVDTQSDSIVDQIHLGEMTDTQTNDLQIDPANPHLLYATGGNAFFKVDLDKLICVDMRLLNQQTFMPHWFVRNPKKTTGYILIDRSDKAFELDLDKATIDAVVELPGIRDDAFLYDAAIDDSGRMLIAQGETILEIDAEEMRLLETHPILPLGSPSVWHFVLSNDQSRIYSITYDDQISKTFVAINTESFHVEAQFELDGGDGINFEFRPYELPDGSKLYAKGGSYCGPIVIQVIETEKYTIQKTITFDEPGLMGTNIGGWHAFAYDSSSHTLFVEGVHVVLAINTDTDVIQKVIYLGDVARAIGIVAGQLTYNGAAGLVYNPKENYLYIAHYDRSFVSIYDLDNDQFLPQVIPLKGFLPTFLFANDDYSKIYCLNGGSDNVSVIDVNSKAVEKVIDLHEYLPTNIQDKKKIATEYTLSQNYPNPFNSSTIISYQIPKSINVSIEIYNILGQKVASLVDNKQNAGRYQIQWEGKNQEGEDVTSGLYILRFSTSDFVQSKKLLLLR